MKKCKDCGNYYKEFTNGISGNRLVIEHVDYWCDRKCKYIKKDSDACKHFEED